MRSQQALDACRAPVAPEGGRPRPEEDQARRPRRAVAGESLPSAPDARADPPSFEVAARRPALRGLPRDNCDGDFVARLFAPHFTPASIHVPTSRRGDANVPRGFAFVDPPPDASPDAVASAVAALRGHPLPRRAPRGSSSLPRGAPRPPTVPTPRRVHLHPSTARSSPSVRVDSNLGRRLIVDGLPPDVTEETATRVFRAHGSVRSVRIFDPREGENDVPRRATVEFETRDAAEAAARAREGATPFFGGGPLRVSRNGESGAGDRNRNRIKSRGRGDEDGRSSRGRGRGSGRDKGRERGRGRGEGNARGGGGGGGEGGYVGVHLAGLPPSASVSIAPSAHLYRR